MIQIDNETSQFYTSFYNCEMTSCIYKITSKTKLDMT